LGSGGKAPGQEPPEAGGILISDAKNKIETEKVNSNKSQMGKIGTGVKPRLNWRWQN